MNLRLYGGRVPLPSNDPDHPVYLVDFPSREEFGKLYSRWVPGQSVDKYYAVLQGRAGGATLVESARQFGVSKERVRQIEAKFFRQMQKLHPQKAPA